ncbi:MAG: Gfo/Idh/MocA family oxidoreductase [Opitutaceae bacterium]|nr:Gfo/Idh/MocA family oxidoreductase [Opitutaceae bacterium]
MNAPLKIGLVGLDTSHVVSFADEFNDSTSANHIPGARIVAGFPGGSPDMELSISRVDGYTKTLREKYDVEIVNSPEVVAEKADAILLTTVDGRLHRDQFSRIAEAGKPVFIDKPLAVCSEDAIAIAAIAKKRGTPLMTSSALRYSMALTDVLERKGRENVTGADFAGPMVLVPTCPGYFWYGIHTAEQLYTSMGKGCEKVIARYSENHDSLIAVWKDGRIGTLRGNRLGNDSFDGMVHFADEICHIDVAAAKKPFTKSLSEAVLAFLLTGNSPIDLEESVEIVRFLEAANESRESGKEVYL